MANFYSKLVEWKLAMFKFGSWEEEQEKYDFPEVKKILYPKNPWDVMGCQNHLF